MTTQKRSSKGQVAVISSKGWLQLRFNYQGKRHYLSLGLKDSVENRKLAVAKAKLIESDMAYERFDPTLEKYRAKASCASDKTQHKAQVTLDRLWSDYVAFREPQVSETTLRLNYARVASHIEKLPVKALERAEQVRNHLITTNSAYTAKRVLIQLNACCNWAVKNEIISSNPFAGMPAEIKRGNLKQNIDPFTPDERDHIIAAFESHPVYNCYADFVRFLFLCGARTSEGVSLRYKHIDSNFTYILFSEAVVCISGQRVRKECKTGKSRLFPINHQLGELLKRRFEEKFKSCHQIDRDALVFPSLTGQEINAHTFNALCWKGTTVRGVYKKGIVTELVERGLVRSYRSQYNTRHTFITNCLESGVSVVQVAKWVGNSPEIIMKHYAGIIKQVEVPEF